MSFDPSPKQELLIEQASYQIAEHPAAPGIAYGQEGRAATVYRLDGPRRSAALKVFKQHFRIPSITSVASRLENLARLPGLTVCRRTVLTPNRHALLLRLQPDLTYSVVMPWIPGPTWLQIVMEQQPITPEQSLQLATALANILAGLEQEGVAHCDLSGANVLLPVFAPQSEFDSAEVELVDVEQLYAPGFERPLAVPSGSDGYAHHTVHQGCWDAFADRFAGAILLAEILGWCDPTIRSAAWGECFFDPQELQRPCKRYDLLAQTLQKRWGDGVASRFSQAWTSQVLADCSTFGEWILTLPERIQELDEQQETVEMDESPLQAEPVIETSPQPVAEEPVPDPPIIIKEERLEQEFIDEQEIVVSTLSESTTATQHSLVGDGLLEICPHCHGPIRAGANPCPRCKQDTSTDTLGRFINAENVQEKAILSIEKDTSTDSTDRSVIIKEKRLEQKFIDEQEIVVSTPSNSSTAIQYSPGSDWLLWYCPNCQSTIRAGANPCPHCGEDISTDTIGRFTKVKNEHGKEISSLGNETSTDSVVVTVEMPPSKNSGKTVFSEPLTRECYFCGANIPNGVEICTNCGKPRIQTSNRVQLLKNTDPKDELVWFFLWITLGFFILIIILSTL